MKIGTRDRVFPELVCPYENIKLHISRGYQVVKYDKSDCCVDMSQV